MAQEVEIQYDLYLAAHLDKPKKNVLIPDYWCDTFNLAESINEGLNKHKNHLIFCSPDLNKIPDFSLIPRETFDSNGDGCYFGKILRAFNTKAEAVAYVTKSRAITPAVYNSKKAEGRTTKQTALLSQQEYNAALGSGYRAMNNRFVIKTEKFCDEISELRNRIVNYNVGNGNDGLDDSDIEFLEDEIGDASDSEAEFEMIVPLPVIITKIKSEIDHETEENVSTSAATQVADAEENVVVAQEPDETIAIGPEPEAESNDGASEQHNDILHGPLKCVVSEVGDQYYPDFDASIRKPIVEILRAWNSTVPFNAHLYDSRFLGVLLREVFGSRYNGDQLDEKRISFVKRLFEIRVNGDMDRFNNFDAIVREKRQKANEKNRRTSTDN